MATHWGEGLIPPLWFAPFTEKVSYKIEDFTFIAQYGVLNYGVVVRQDSPIKSFKELVAFARANPDKLSVGTLGEGSAGQIRKSKLDSIPRYGLGEGIGLGLEEFPLIAEREKEMLAKGMCLTLRLAIKDPEAGAVMIGNTVYVSKNGPEVLT